MGAWFASFLGKNGYRIIICDRNKQAGMALARKNHFQFLDNPKHAVRQAQLVLLAVPTKTTSTVLKKITPYISKESLIIEISSVKEPVEKTLLQLKKQGFTVLSIHPMFGPGAKTLRGRMIIRVLASHGKATKRFLSLLREKGARILPSNFDEHDKLVSITLTLPHFMNIAFVSTMQAYGIGPKALRAASGTTFKLQALIAEAIFQESFSNEVSILKDSTQSLKVLHTYMRCCEQILSQLAKGTRGKLYQELKKDLGYLTMDAMFSVAYDGFNDAVEASGTN